MQLYQDGETYVRYGMGTLRVFCKLCLKINHIWRCSWKQNWNNKSRNVLEGPENHLDEFSLISVGTGEPLKSFKQKRLIVVMFEEDSFGIW